MYIIHRCITRDTAFSVPTATAFNIKRRNNKWAGRHVPGGSLVVHSPDRVCREWSDRAGVRWWLGVRCWVRPESRQHRIPDFVPRSRPGCSNSVTEKENKLSKLRRNRLITIDVYASPKVLRVQIAKVSNKFYFDGVIFIEFGSLVIFRTLYIDK